MKATIKFLIHHRQHLPLTTLLKFIAMAGLSAINSKLKHLSTVTSKNINRRKISVVHYTDDDNIVIPENAADNILLVPKPCKTLDEWQRQCSVK